MVRVVAAGCLAGALTFVSAAVPLGFPSAAPSISAPSISAPSISATGRAGDTGDSGPETAIRVVQYSSPVTPMTVVRAFAPPLVKYGSGHLGVDLRSRPNQAVTAAADGIVVFAGQVAGRGVVVVAHADGVRTEYEPVLPSVRRGAGVRRASVIGVVSARHPGCPGSCLHWGARRATTYLDPLSLLQPLGPVTLLPSAGLPADR